MSDKYEVKSDSVGSTLGQLFMNGYRHKENRMDVFPDTQLLHGGLSTRLPCKSMEQMHCPGGNSTIFFFVSWGLFHDRFWLFKFADSFIDLSKLKRVVSRSALGKQKVYYPRVSAEAEDVRYTIQGFGVLIKNDFEV